MTHLGQATVEAIVAAACRAPSVHNSQPWTWAYDGERLHLYADWGRQLEKADPDGRDLEVSCGAALHHAVTAADGEGLAVDVERLPDRGSRTHVAALGFREGEWSSSAIAMSRMIWARHTDRRSPSSTPVPDDAVTTLTRIGAERGAFVVPVHTAQDGQLLRDLRQLSVLAQHDDGRLLEEREGWIHSQRPDGVPDGSILVQDPGHSRFSITTRYPSGALADHGPAEGEPAPTWLLLATSSDDTLSRIRAGEALSALLLQATALDLAAVPYTQAVEVDATRRRLEERVLGGGSCLQLVLRLAVPPAAGPRIPMTRRRPLHDVLSIRG